MEDYMCIREDVTQVRDAAAAIKNCLLASKYKKKLTWDRACKHHVPMKVQRLPLSEKLFYKLSPSVDTLSILPCLPAVTSHS